jgi:peptidase E
MIAFLTSSPGGSYLEGGVRKPCRLSEENGLLDRLSAVWPEKARCLLICAEPDNSAENDGMRRNFLVSLPMSGLSLSSFVLCDSRSADALPSLLAESDVVILSGGHTLTQNRFFRRLGLKDLIRSFDGVLIGISGGSMNSAKVVYAQPEWEGDFEDPSYERFPEGLGLTDIMILPHYQLLKDQVLEGKRLIEDVALPDSMGRTFYALPDGSYVQLKDGKSEIVGEAYVIHDGSIRRL